MRAICVWINGVKLSQSKCYNFFSALCSDLFIILVEEVKKSTYFDFNAQPEIRIVNLNLKVKLLNTKIFCKQSITYYE